MLVCLLLCTYVWFISNTNQYQHWGTLSQGYRSSFLDTGDRKLLVTQLTPTLGDSRMDTVTLQIQSQHLRYQLMLTLALTPDIAACPKPRWKMWNCNVTCVLRLCVDQCQLWLWIMREGSCTQVKDLVMVDVTIACSYRVMLAASCDYDHVSKWQTWTGEMCKVDANCISHNLMLNVFACCFWYRLLKIIASESENIDC